MRMIEGKQKSSSPTNLNRAITLEQEKSIKQLIDTVDKDGDGKLNEYELHSVLIAHGILVPIDVVLDLFQAADSNNDGLLFHS